MIEIIRLAVLVDGTRGEVRWVVPADAHAAGVSPAKGSEHWRMMDDYGTPEGALSVGIYAATALRKATDQVAGAWSTPTLPGL